MHPAVHKVNASTLHHLQGRYAQIQLSHCESLSTWVLRKKRIPKQKLIHNICDDMKQKTVGFVAWPLNYFVINLQDKYIRICYIHVMLPPAHD